MLKYSEFIRKYQIQTSWFWYNWQELEYALFEITDVFPELDTRIDSGGSSSIIASDINI
jgi:hypothetical protein